MNNLSHSPLWLVPALIAALIAGCGGPGLATPTAIPAGVVRPAQPAPAYVDDAGRFTLATPRPTIMAAPAPGENNPTAMATRPAIRLPVEQRPTALGILRQAGVLRIAPGGDVRESLPFAATVTVTGRSADGRAYAVFTDAGETGWVDAGAVTLFGGDDLLVVEYPIGPGPIATLIAEAMAPVEPSVLATFDAR